MVCIALVVCHDAIGYDSCNQLFCTVEQIMTQNSKEISLPLIGASVVAKNIRLFDLDLERSRIVTCCPRDTSYVDAVTRKRYGFQCWSAT